MQPLVDSGAAVPLFSLGQVDAAGNIVRDPNFPDIPTVVEVYRTLNGTDPSGPAYEAYRTLLGVTYTYQKAMWVPQDTPPQAAELLRRSAEEMGADPVFNAEAEKVLGGYPIVADPRLAGADRRVLPRRRRREGLRRRPARHPLPRHDRLGPGERRCSNPHWPPSNHWLIQGCSSCS